MPYKVEGSDVMHLKDGKWKVKQRCSSPKNAHDAIKLLEGIESGSITPADQKVYARKHDTHKVLKEMYPTSHRKR